MSPLPPLRDLPEAAQFPPVFQERRQNEKTISSVQVDKMFSRMRQPGEPVSISLVCRGVSVLGGRAQGHPSFLGPLAQHSQLGSQGPGTRDHQKVNCRPHKKDAIVPPGVATAWPAYRRRATEGQLCWAERPLHPGASSTLGRVFTSKPVLSVTVRPLPYYLPSWVMRRWVSFFLIYLF